MKYRLVHTQTTKGPILINDIDQGLPVEFLDEERKQDCYVTFNHKYFQDRKVITDTTIAGYIDLVPSDKVKLSVEQGVIAGHVASGAMQIVEIPNGALNVPTIVRADQDQADGDDVTDDYRVEIEGANFMSFAPYETSVTLTDGDAVVTLSMTDILDGGGTFTSTLIIIPQAVHGFADDGNEDITDVAVTTESGVAESLVDAI